MIENEVRDFFDKHSGGLVAAYLFGSHSRGTQTVDSDVDVGVLLDNEPPTGFAGLHLDLQADLAMALGHDVDLIVLNRAPPDLIHRVLRDGKLIVDLDPSCRIRFEVRARSQYLDLLPALREYRKQRATPS